MFFLWDLSLKSPCFHEKGSGGRGWVGLSCVQKILFSVKNYFGRCFLTISHSQAWGWLPII